MTVRGKNVGAKFSDKKWHLAMSLMQRDYIFLSKHSNMFIIMSKEEENDWVATTINEYYKNHTIKELEKMLDGGYILKSNKI